MLDVVDIIYSIVGNLFAASFFVCLLCLSISAVVVICSFAFCFIVVGFFSCLWFLNCFVVVICSFAFCFVVVGFFSCLRFFNCFVVVGRSFAFYFFFNLWLFILLL